ncbi:MAG: heme-binding domain-containing protein [Bacteroidota bacterium]
MNKKVKYALLGIIALLIIIQFFTGEKPTVTSDNPGDIHQVLSINTEVSKILKEACYDCHSNETIYPWYASVAPVSWLVIHDVNEGRRELNFSTWAEYPVKRKNHKLDEVIELVEEGEMPMPIYTITHSEAKLSQEDIKLLVDWAKASMTPE